ncbi:MAG: thiamine pyrophosphate-dependent enzyme [Acholeplasmataceae bacterium]|jgi:2-oxoglutarate ferredoxin oxidoreductase subunit beta
MQMYKRSKGLTNKSTHFCPGCTHGILHKLLAETLEELNILDKSVGIASVGCSVTAYEYINCDFLQAAHGRALAVATGVKRVLPNNIVFTYQGDGDLASIGIAETIHAANRGENITVIFANNAIYGMTGGQMAPTTLPNQITTTSPSGRDTATQGNPIPISEMLAQIKGVAYVERVALTSPQSAIRIKRSIKKALEYQMEGLGFTLIEVLSTCPVNFRQTPIDAMKSVQTEMTKIYPLGVYKDVKKL